MSNSGSHEHVNLLSPAMEFTSTPSECALREEGRRFLEAGCAESSALDGWPHWTTRER
jgi:hypothetical protein